MRQLIPRTRKANRTSFPAPVGGINASDLMQNMPLNDAIILDNLVPNNNSVTIRNGFKTYLAGFDNPIKTIMAYQSTSEQLLCASDDKIFLINKTTPPTKTEKKTGLINGFWDCVNFGTPEGQFLICVNGADPMQIYSGTSFSNAAITGLKSGEAVNGASFRAIVAHKSRLWVIRDNFTVGYLAPQSIQGAISNFELGSLFSYGGKLVGLFTFSFNNTNNGSDDYLGFISNQGEIVIYQGTDPSSASTWSIVGVYKMPPPVGKRFVTNFNGDALILTQNGVYSVQAMMQSGFNFYENTLAKKINPLIRDFFNKNASNDNCSLVFIPLKNKIYLTLKDINNNITQYVMNANNNAWCRYVDMPYEHGIAQDGIMYAIMDKTLYLYEHGANDNGAFIKCKMLTAFTNFGIAEKKYVTHLKPYIQCQPVKTFKLYLETVTDFSEVLLTNEITKIAQSVAIWDEARYDEANWTDDSNKILNDWIAAGGLGTYIAVALSLNGIFPEFSLTAIDAQYQVSQS